MKTFLFFSVMSLFCLTVSAQDWHQMGADINGVNNGDHSGASVSISNDGLTIATGSFSNHDNGSFAGHVRVFTFSGTDWVLKGDRIVGLTGERGVGSSVSLSGDGNRIAICISSENIPPPKGKIRIYDWNGTSWTQVGNDILWHGASFYFGSVALSRNGQVVGVGDFSEPTNGDFSGQVRLYTLNGNTWLQRGSSIEGTAGGQTGFALSISNDGNTFATNLRDEIQVYQWNGTDYTPKGNILNPFSLKNVTINGNGTWVAVSGENANGETERKGATQVYKWNGSSWQSEGIPIQGEPGSLFGHALSFSDNAQVLAISSIFNFEIFSPGEVRVFIQNGANWKQTGNTIIGPQSLDYYGNSISLNKTGNIIGIGVPGYLSSSYGFKDRTQVFRNDEVLSVLDKIALTPVLFPNPVSNQLTIRTDVGLIGSNYTVLNIMGQTVLSGKINSDHTLLEVGNLPGGIYLVQIQSKKGGFTSRFMKE